MADGSITNIFIIRRLQPLFGFYPHQPAIKRSKMNVFLSQYNIFKRGYHAEIVVFSGQCPTWTGDLPVMSWWL